MDGDAAFTWIKSQPLDTRSAILEVGAEVNFIGTLKIPLIRNQFVHCTGLLVRPVNGPGPCGGPEVAL
jgi:hypothetical protein